MGRGALGETQSHVVRDGCTRFVTSDSYNVLVEQVYISPIARCDFRLSSYVWNGKKGCK